MRLHRAVLAALPLTALVAADGTVDPLVDKSAYRDKTVWSYHDKDPVPWTKFRPKDFGGTQVPFSAAGVRSVGKVPQPGVHPRLFFGPDDLPALRKRLKEDPAGQAAWLNILAWTNALKLTYDEKAAYAQPDWANGSFGIKGRFVDLHRIGGYNPKREDYYRLLSEGKTPPSYAETDDKGKLKRSPAGFFKPAACEAFRCLIENDAAGAKVLAKATITAIKLEQARRDAEDKPTAPGQPPRPSTGRSDACALGFIYDFIFNYLTPEQKKTIHAELVLLSSWADNYGTFNNAEASRSNWATFSYWVFDLMAIEGESGFNDLKFLGLYRGWRNFFTYGFFDSGAAYEGEGKMLFGLDAVVTFDRIAHKYGLEPLSQHPLPRAYYDKFASQSMLPTRDSWAVFDILGGMGGGFTTPHDLVVARWLYPQDRTTGVVYRALVGDDYRRLPSGLHFHWHQAITSAIFATAYDQADTPEAVNLPTTFFCGQRALLMTRSSWDPDATFLTMQIRGASGGHPYPDRNGLMLSGVGRPWVTIPGKDIGGWAMNTVLIDKAEQSETTPARVVDYVDGPQATFATGDASYAWNWVWRVQGKSTDDAPLTKDAVDAGKVAMGPSWQLLDQSFNDFAWTKVAHPVYQKPLKYANSWIAFDGILSPYSRHVGTPVMHAYRTAGVVRGAHPYVLVSDDIQRDGLPARYDWNLTLASDVRAVEVDLPGLQPGDTVLVGHKSLGDDGNLAPKSPALLVRVLAAQGERQPTEIRVVEKMNLLTVATIAPAPGFRVLLYPFRLGQPLPTTSWETDGQRLRIAIGDQVDEAQFTPTPSGRQQMVLRRGGEVIARLDRAEPALGDPASAALREEQVQLAPRLEALEKSGFDPASLPGYLASWDFSTVVDQGFNVAAGSQPGVSGFSLPDDGEASADDHGRAVVRTKDKAMEASFDRALVPVGGPVTLSWWTRTRPNAFMGSLLNWEGFASMDILQGNLRLGVRGLDSGDGWPGSVFSAWCHVALTWDGTQAVFHRNGRPLTILPPGKGPKVGNRIRLGGTNGYGTADADIRDVLLYRSALTSDQVRDLYLWGLRRP